MTILGNGLETDDYGMSGWIYIINNNIDKLNYALLKIQALQDIDTTYLQHGAMLTWDAVEEKWIPRIYGYGLYDAPGTTTTTSTTTTSTTSTTTSTTTTTV